MNPLRIDPYKNETQQAKNHYRETLVYLNGRLSPGMTVIDMGQRSPMTDLIERKLWVKITNTRGDLDSGFQYEDTTPADVVIYSHTIEHQFNPLYTLMRIKEVLKPYGTLYIMVPSRGKLLWTRNHYHEIDKYRMGLLLERAGYKIEKHERVKHWRGFWDYFTGARMILRAIFEYSACYTCKMIIN